MRALALSLLIPFLGACCLKSVTLKPALSNLEYQASKVGNVSADLTFDFDTACCPSKEQNEIAVQLQSRVQSAFADLQSGRITLDQYNTYITAANNAISNVVLVCKRGTASGGLAGISDPWQRVKEVANAPL